MNFKSILKLVNQAAGKNGSAIAKELQITPGAYSQYLNSDFSSLERFIKICKICGCEITITSKNGVNIKL